jgi:ABC-type bacteriocin/lantibiotic exporter with double-glycine peptidase domain
MGMKIRRIAILVMMVLTISVGCATAPPVKKPQISKLTLPDKHAIAKVPIYRQTYMDCGPTSLRMVLNFYGKNYSQEEVVKARWGRGTKTSDMESYARSQGFIAYSYYDSDKKNMKYLIAQGYPLITLGVPPPNWRDKMRYIGEGHYVVVVGYDETKKAFMVHDPAPGRRLEIPYEVFKDFHSSSLSASNYVLCIYPKR